MPAVLFVYRCRNKAQEKGVRLVGTAAEFGMELHPDIKSVAGKLDSFDYSAVGRGSAYYQSGGRQLVRVIVVEFVTVAVTHLAIAVPGTTLHG